MKHSRSMFILVSILSFIALWQCFPLIILSFPLASLIALGAVSCLASIGFLTRRLSFRKRFGVVVCLGLLVISTLEVFLPMTPIKYKRITKRENERLSQVEPLLRMSDEPVLTANGHPIGIRIRFDVRVKKTSAQVIGVSVGMPSKAPEREFYDSQIGSGLPPIINPRPKHRGQEIGDIFQIFEEGVVYSFTQEFVPNFLMVSHSAAPCIKFYPNLNHTEAEVIDSITKISLTEYDFAVTAAPQFGGGVPKTIGQFRTKNKYSPALFYSTALKESFPRCQF